MMGGQVLPLMPPPDDKDVRRAIARALLEIRSNEWTLEKIGREIGCCGKSVARAISEETMLGFDSIALLMFKFPAARPHIESLWRMGEVEKPTPRDRFETIKRHMSALLADIET